MNVETSPQQEKIVGQDPLFEESCCETSTRNSRRAGLFIGSSSENGGGSPTSRNHTLKKQAMVLQRSVMSTSEVTIDLTFDAKAEAQLAEKQIAQTWERIQHLASSGESDARHNMASSALGADDVPCDYAPESPAANEVARREQFSFGEQGGARHRGDAIVSTGTMEGSRRRTSKQARSEKSRLEINKDGKGYPYVATITSTIVREEDVLHGRGKALFIHPGNVYFRTLCADRLERYRKASSRLVKVEIINEVVDIVQGIGGRFLRRDSNGDWREVTSDIAKEKTGHTFRDALGNRNKGVLKMHTESKLRATASAGGSSNFEGAKSKSETLLSHDECDFAMTGISSTTNNNVGQTAPVPAETQDTWGSATASERQCSASRPVSRTTAQEGRLFSSPIMQQCSNFPIVQHRATDNFETSPPIWHDTGRLNTSWFDTVTLVTGDELQEDLRSIVADDSLYESSRE